MLEIPPSLAVRQRSKIQSFAPVRTAPRAEIWPSHGAVRRESLRSRSFGVARPWGVALGGDCQGAASGLVGVNAFQVVSRSRRPGRLVPPLRTPAPSSSFAASSDERVMNRRHGTGTGGGCGRMDSSRSIHDHAGEHGYDASASPESQPIESLAPPLPLLPPVRCLGGSVATPLQGRVGEGTNGWRAR